MLDYVTPFRLFDPFDRRKTLLESFRIEPPKRRRKPPRVRCPILWCIQTAKLKSFCEFGQLDLEKDVLLIYANEFRRLLVLLFDHVCDEIWPKIDSDVGTLAPIQKPHAFQDTLVDAVENAEVPDL